MNNLILTKSATNHRLHPLNVGGAGELKRMRANGIRHDKATALPGPKWHSVWTVGMLESDRLYAHS